MTDNFTFGIAFLLLAIMFIGVGILSGFMVGGERMIVGYMGIVGGLLCIAGSIKAFILSSRN